MILAQSFAGSYPWTSISLAILVAALLVTAYVLMRRLRSRRLLVQRVKELETLSAAGRALVASQLDIDALCGLIVQEASNVIDNRTFQIGLFDDHFYHIIYWTIDGVEQPTPHTFDLQRYESSLVGWMRESKQPLLIRDLLKEADSLPARPRFISKTPPRSAIVLPLLSGERTIGIISAQSNQAHRFNEEDLRRLMILANQAAAAIANAQLYQQARRRAAHLELVGQIALRVNAASDLDDIFEQVVVLTRQTFGYHPVTIFGLDPQSGAAVIKASSEALLAATPLSMAPGEGLVGAAVATRNTIVSANTGEDDRFVAQLDGVDDLETGETLSEIAIPLLVNGEVLGVLDVQSPEINAFSQVEQTALEALAAEVAAAIHKAQQLQQQRERAWITTAQLQVAEAINRSHGLEEIITAVVRLTPMLTGVSFCAMLLWEEEPQLYRGAAFFDGDHDATDPFSQIQIKIGDWSPLDAVHVGQEMLVTQRLPAWLQEISDQAADTTEITLVPVSTKSQIIGVVLVNDYGVPRQTPLVDSSVDYRHAELLQNIADQTAQSLESAHLRLAQQEEAWVNTALLQVAEAVNNLIDLNEILDTIVRLVPMLVGAQSAIIMIWDEARGVFLPGPSHGVSEMGLGLLQTLEVDREEFASLVQQAARVLSPTATYYTIELPDWLKKVLGQGRANAFPLNARGQLVGMMVVALADKNGRAFSSRRLNILNGIAHQAATAVVNNHLYREAAERQRLEQELNVAREIQASLIPQRPPEIPGCSVAAYWQAARQVSGDFYDFLPLPNGHWGIVVADVADKGVPAALFMALSRTILRTVAFSGHDPARVLERVNELIDNDSQTDLFVTMFYAIWQPETGQLVYANGGHNPPILLSRNGAYQELHGKGMALGVLPQIQVDPVTVTLKANDTVVFYTDGVTEAINEDYDEFGLERLLIATKSARKGDAQQVVQAITHGITHHAGDTPQFDDITLVVLKRNSDSQSER